MKVVREVCLFFFLVCLKFQLNSVHGSVTLNLNYERGSSFGTAGRLVKKHERMPLLSTEFGSISTVDIDDGTGRHNYHLQFITLEPNSLFLPVLLHADMVFFVHTGSGRLSWIDIDKDEVKRIELQRGDLYRLKSGALFYLHSSLEPERPRLRIISIFANSENDDNELQLQDPSIGPYSSINDLVRGFDTKVLQAAFQVPEEVIEEITSATDMPAIVHAETGKKKSNFWDENALFLNAFISIKRYNKVAAYENKKKDIKTFNFLKEKPDVKNCNGWSTVVTKHELHALEGSHIGAFMVNLTKGSMMGPHWNPKATEVSVVLDGEAMVRVVCPSTLTSRDCKNTRFRVEEGDVFVVPRFHPMAQTAFNDNSLAFMGFSSTTKKNHPQFLVGKASVLQTLNRFILAASFSVSNATIDKLLAAQKQSIILDCTNCAEEEEMLMEKEIEDVRWEEEEERKREEEKQRKREEEKQRQQEEEERRREEEERRRKEEERKRQEEEEERRRQEEEEEEEKRRQEEEEEEEEERRRKEEEEKEKAEEEAKRREEEERRRREQEKEIEREAEEARRMEEERSRREEEKRRQAEEERQREKEGRRREEEERQQQEEERREQRRQEEARERAEQRQQEQEQEQQRQREEAMERAEQERQRQQEEAMERAEQERQRQQEEAMERAEEEEQQRQWEEARERAEERRQEERQRQEEEAMERAEQRRRKEAWQRQREEAMERAEQRRRKEEWQRQQEEARERAEQTRRHERERREASEEEETEAAAARREERERVERERQEDEAARRRGMEFNMEQRHQQTKMFGEMGKGKGHSIRSSKFARSL